MVKCIGRIWSNFSKQNSQGPKIFAVPMPMLVLMSRCRSQDFRMAHNEMTLKFYEHASAKSIFFTEHLWVNTSEHNIWYIKLIIELGRFTYIWVWLGNFKYYIQNYLNSKNSKRSGFLYTESKLCCSSKSFFNFSGILVLSFW